MMNVTETPMQQYPAIELERKPKSLKTTIHKLHTNHSKTEAQKRVYLEGWGTGTEARARKKEKKKQKEISEAKIVRKWFGTWFSHDRHTCPFFKCV